MTYKPKNWQAAALAGRHGTANSCHSRVLELGVNPNYTHRLPAPVQLPRGEELSVLLASCRTAEMMMQLRLDPKHSRSSSRMSSPRDERELIVWFHIPKKQEVRSTSCWWMILILAISFTCCDISMDNFWIKNLDTTFGASRLLCKTCYSVLTMLATPQEILIQALRSVSLLTTTPSSSRGDPS